MARYPNGRIPDSELVRLGVEHYATPATAQRIRNLVADIRANEGFTLEVTGGPNIYRNLKWQKFYWDVLPYPQAAYPGTSSHGGEYQGRDAIAVDFNNWAILPKQKWFDYARKHGFTPNIFSWEPWHVVDFNPWVMPGPSGGGIAPSPEPEIKKDEEDSMKLFGYKNTDGRIWYVQFDTSSGFWSEFVTNDKDYVRALAEKWTPNGIPELTVGHRNDLKAEADAIKAR